MPRVYGVQDADEKLSGWMSEDETATAPTGETAVLESTIRAADPPGADGRIQSGGHWDGTTYTPPAGTEYFIPSTNIVAIAANNMLDVFDAGLGYIEDNRLFWPQAVVERSHRRHPLADHQLGAHRAQRCAHGVLPAEVLRGSGVMA